MSKRWLKREDVQRAASELKLPSRQFRYCRDDEENRPQPRLDANLPDGMTVGRPRAVVSCCHKFVALGHNTIRGAAGVDPQRRADEEYGS